MVGRLQHLPFTSYATDFNQINKVVPSFVRFIIKDHNKILILHTTEGSVFTSVSDKQGTRNIG